MAFKALGEPDRAVASLERAVAQAPEFLEAQQELRALREQLSIPPQLTLPVHQRSDLPLVRI
jgi:hypothetical protein